MAKASGTTRVARGGKNVNYWIGNSLESSALESIGIEPYDFQGTLDKTGISTRGIASTAQRVLNSDAYMNGAQYTETFTVRAIGPDIVRVDREVYIDESVPVREYGADISLRGKTMQQFLREARNIRNRQ